MAYLKCPRCGTTVEERPGLQTVCPNCGFSGDAPGQPQPSAYGQPSGYAPSGPTAGAYSASPYGAQGGGGGYLPPAAPVPQPAPPHQHGQYAPAQSTNGMAITALVMGIVGIFFQLTAPLAIIFGIVGRKQCKERDEKGEGMALAGIILGSVVVGIFLLFVLFLFAMWGSLFYSL